MNINTSDLEEYRKSIDFLDSDLVKILAERMKIVEKVAMHKKTNNIPPLDEKRWKKVLNKNIKIAKKADLDMNLVKDIFNTIHKYALIREKDLIDKKNSRE